MDGIPLDGVYTWQQARQLGVTRSQIRDDGLPVARGLFVSRALAPDLVTTCRAWAERLPDDAAFGMGTAAALLGAPCPGSGRIHVVLTPRRVLPQFGGITVHARAVAPSDITEINGIRVTSGAQTFLDLAARLPPRDLVPLGDGLMRAGAMDGDALAHRLLRADRVRGVVRAREWAPHLTALAGSQRESLMRYWLLSSRLPHPDVQIPFFDRWGQEVAHADLGWARRKVALEYEGRQHADRHGMSDVQDRSRRALISRGWQGARGQRARTSFRAASTRATLSGAAFGPIRPIRQTVAA